MNTLPCTTNPELLELSTVGAKLTGSLLYHGMHQHEEKIGTIQSCTYYTKTSTDL